MNRWSLIGVGLLATGLLRADAAGGQSASPIDSARAVALLREAVEELRVSRILGDDEAFQRNLSFLFGVWGEDWSPPVTPEPPAPRPLYEITDSLTRRGQVDRAIALAIEQEGYARRRALVPILDWMVEHGETERMLVFADTIGESGSGIMALLGPSRPRPTPWRLRVERIGRFLREESRDTASIRENWATVVGFVKYRDPGAAWSIAERNLGPPHRTEVLLGLLGMREARRGLPVDSLIQVVHERILRLRDRSARAVQLAQLARLCRDSVFESCGRLALPEDPSAILPPDVANRFRRAIEGGRWAEAESIGDTLRQLTPDHLYYPSLAEALGEATSRRGYDSVLETLGPALDSVAATLSGAAGDRLNLALAGLWAVHDPERAWRAITRTQSPDRRAEALRNLVGSAHRTDLPLAIEALAHGGFATRGLDLAGLYADALRWRDSARARDIFRLLPDGAERMRARLLWAGIIAGTGRWGEARRLAFEALDEWDPVTEPRPLSWGLFQVFARLGVYEELVAWARSRETADARASALVAIVGSVGLYRAPGDPPGYLF